MIELTKIVTGTVACHASTLAECSDGSILVAWFGGSAEGKNDVAIWMCRIRNGEYSTPALIAKLCQLPHWNPVLYADGSQIFLYFKVGRTVSHWKTYVMHSGDDGETWSSAKELVPGDRGGRGPVKNKCIKLSDGTIAAPASTEHFHWRPFVDLSRDGGMSWVRSADLVMENRIVGQWRGKPVRYGAIQPTLWESAPGTVSMLMRSNMGKILRADSCDGGQTWSKVRETSMPSNNSGIDLTRLADGRLALLCNPISGHWAARSPLTLFLSGDNGESFRPLINVAEEEGKEFSYPAIISLRDGGVAFAFTWKREKIAFGRMETL